MPAEHGSGVEGLAEEVPGWRGLGINTHGNHLLCISRCIAVALRCAAFPAIPAARHGPAATCTGLGLTHELGSSIHDRQTVAVSQRVAVPVRRQRRQCQRPWPLLDLPSNAAGLLLLAHGLRRAQKIHTDDYVHLCAPGASRVENTARHRVALLSGERDAHREPGVARVCCEHHKARVRLALCQLAERGGRCCRWRLARLGGGSRTSAALHTQDC